MPGKSVEIVMKKALARSLPLALGLMVLVAITPALAQDYSFSLDSEHLDAYWQPDGSLTLSYVMQFSNDAFGVPIDYVDIGVPNDTYSLSRVQAAVNGKEIQDIEDSPVVSPGIALGLGIYAIPPGSQGTVTATIQGITDVLFVGSEQGYASAELSPTWFDSKYVHGNTDLTVAFHLPAGVKPDEPRYYKAPSGWPATPQTGLDDQGRVLYVWNNPSANGHTRYVFGASFPASYVPAGAVARPSIAQQLGISADTLFSILCCTGVALFVIGFIVLAIVMDRRRKLAYLPPKIAVEGHGIKRGLTAVEAAILLETPLDRALTMILFGVVKKNAAKVASDKPLQIERITPAPADLREYETQFIDAMVETDQRRRRIKLQDLTIGLVKSVQTKMKGFSLKETRDYYREIMRKAWQEVEQAGTPEVRSDRYAENLEWTMLDNQFDDRTRRVFSGGPVFLPIWWGNYQPITGSARTGAPALPHAAGPSPLAGATLPQLPGADFAASMVKGVQNFAGGAIDNVLGFTQGVTSKTNPPPPPSRSSGGFHGGGGGGCACACACAGCACACAGGGR
jgi:hypothetical protein